MAIDLVSRRDWNARTPRGDYTQLDSAKGVKVHYTGGRVDPGIVSDHEACTALVRSIQGHHMDGNGWIDIGYCVDEETEILTRQGWRSWCELRPGDIVLTLDHGTGMSVWQPVLDVCVFPPREREMIRMRGAGHSSLSTPHHRWPVERRRRVPGSLRWRGPGATWLPAARAGRTVTVRERRWVTTETIAGDDRITIAAPCADLPTEPKWSDAFVELLAWFCTAGAVDRAGGGVAIHRPPDDEAHLMRIRAALHAVLGPPADRLHRGGAWRETLSDDRAAFRLPARAGRELLEAAPGGVPALGFLLCLTRAQLDLYVATCLAGGDGPDGFAREDRTAAEAFMFAALLSGSEASLHRVPPADGNGPGGWKVSVGRRRHVVPRPAARRGALGMTIRKETYDGRIWCPRIENQSWLARRDGTVYFTGNTMIACPHRKVFQGRGPHHLPAANGPGLNSGHYAVLGLVGSTGLVQPPDGVLHAVLDAIEHLRTSGRAGKEIKGHRDGYATACPGDPLYAWVRRGAPRPGGTAEPPPPPSAPPFPGRLLRYPPVTRGEDVRTWQAQMRKRGWDIDVDGAYGPESRDVCRSFQRVQGIDDDGIVGPITWRLAWEAPTS
ncbi:MULTISPECIES: peptidoglycan-binding protein [unclassified Nonomuraea]|uniref:peptidoglycan-binding protein n=1 Tax=unclassified Nonomuraea TaxID=2593643 RepID=UPI00207BBAFE|nr:peptidoglycan-binding protein [Nonomuraea sp. KC401]